MGHSHAPGAHPGHEHEHGTDQKRVLIAACLTGGFMIAEAVGGLVAGSLALLADAGHMLTDFVSLSLAWYAYHLAAKPASARFTYGADRMKTLVAYTNGLAVFAVGVWIVVEAWHRISEPEPVLAGPMLAIAAVGLVVNIAAFAVLHGGSRESLNMRGALLHVLGDLLGSVAALAAGGIILTTGWTPADPILSAFVALLLFRSAWSLVREAGHVLLEGAPESLDRDGVADDLSANIKGLRAVHHMHVWTLDGTRTMATLHACLQPGADAHEVITAIKARLFRDHGIEHVTVEPEYDRCADAEIRQRLFH